jgi:hypothetical protein
MGKSLVAQELVEDLLVHRVAIGLTSSRVRVVTAYVA